MLNFWLCSCHPHGDTCMEKQNWLFSSLKQHSYYLIVQKYPLDVMQRRKSQSCLSLFASTSSGRDPASFARKFCKSTSSGEVDSGRDCVTKYTFTTAGGFFSKCPIIDTFVRSCFRTPSVFNCACRSDGGCSAGMKLGKKTYTGTDGLAPARPLI